MQLLFVLSFMVVSQQSCYGAIKSFGPLDMRTRRMYSFKGLPKFPELTSDEKRELYSYEQTIVVRDAGLDGQVRHCEVLEVYQENESTDVLMILKNLLNLEIQILDMDRMMALLDDCDSVDNVGDEEVLEIDEEEEGTTIPTKKSDSRFSVTNGIFPGTKWCGFGDIANGYHDLGKVHNVDRCCRSHDFCPIKVLGRDERYNLTNKAIYTKSHCFCDEAFYECLKKDNGWSASFIGNLYFYAASPKCVTGVPEKPDKKMEFVPATRKW